MSSRVVPPAGGFRADIEGLRAVAVLLVLADHLLGRPVGGYVGVDVFFVVSGYLITGLLVRELLETGRIRFRAFYARRVRRLLPAALVVLAVTAVVAQLLFLPVRAAQSARDALWAAGFAANWRFASLGTDYFSSTRPPSPVQHYWSLAVEEQFYLVWPALLLAVAATVPLLRGAHRVTAISPTLLTRRLTVVIGVVAVTSLTWSVWLTSSSPQTAYFSTAARTFELAAGALLAVHAERLRRLPAPAAAALSATGLAGIVLAALVLSPTTAFPGWAALLPVLATCAVLAAGGGERLPGPSRLLALPAPRYVGRISYSLYLWHWPVLVFATALTPGVRGVVLVPVSLLLATASYAFVEEPLRRRRRPAAVRPRRAPVPTRQVALPGVLALSLLVITLSAGGVLAPGGAPADRSSEASRATTTVLPNGEVAQREPTNAWPSPLPLQQEVRAALSRPTWGQLDPPLEALQGAAAPEWVRSNCLDVFPEKEAGCVFGSSTARRTAVLLGDSVAISWLPGLRAALEPSGYRIHVLTRRQCSLGAPEDAISPGCRIHLDRVLARTRALAPDLVIVSGSYRAAARALEPGDAAAWERQLAGRLRPLAAPGRSTVVLGAPPQSGNLQACATRVSATTDCVREVAGVWQALAEADRAGAEAAGARYVEVRPWFCADGRCPAVLDGTPVAFDGVHLTAAHSRRLALILREETEAA